MRIRLCAQQQKRQRRPHRGDPCARAARRGGRPQVPRLVSTHLRSTYSVHTRFQEVRPRTNSSQTERATTVSRRPRSEEHTSELQSPCNLVCRLLLEKKKNHVR